MAAGNRLHLKFRRMPLGCVGGLVVFAGVVVAIQLAIAADPGPTPTTLRDAVLRPDCGDDAAAAYRAYFLGLGRTELKNLLRDESTGIALQAAWETHLTPAVRKDNGRARTNKNIYDPVELRKFVTFFTDRTKAPLPDWWANAITDVELFPGRHHAFNLPLESAQVKPKGSRTSRKRLKVTEIGRYLVCTVGELSVQFPKDTFDDITFADSFVGWIGKERSVIAAYSRGGGDPYQVVGFKGQSRTPAWKANVWASRRGLSVGFGYHRVEMTEKNGVVYVFGIESHGAYVEAFDADNGKPQFRFCTCYWSRHSESWGLK